ncbi:MAG: DUF1501 domain-containing protein [Arenicella sp.]|nr:DUF1501 domain-containing protein [Arenicella sp.]
MQRRTFVKSLLATAVSASLNTNFSTASANPSAGFVPVIDPVLVNIMMGGGPDFRHFIVPAMPGINGVLVPDQEKQQFAYLYWQFRSSVHRLTLPRGDYGSDQDYLLAQEESWRSRWNDDFIHFDLNTFAGSENAERNPVYIGQNTTTNVFGIWQGAGWLVQMFSEGKVAIVANVVGATHRAHDHATLQINQGNLLSNVDDGGRSGWGGRLATQAQGTSIALTDTPSPFAFGPVTSPSYQPDLIDNSNLVPIQNSRDLGLREADLDQDQSNRPDFALARTLKSYYSALKQETLAPVYENFTGHEEQLRLLGQQMSAQLDFNVPDEIRALYSQTLDRTKVLGGALEANPRHHFNNDSMGNSRRVCYNENWGSQVRNLYDSLAANNVLGLKVASMEYNLEWDSHSQQRKNIDVPDLKDPYINRGIESSFKDIFGGPTDSNTTELHYGLSALWHNLDTTSKQNITFVAAGEFGRQIRANGDFGTDHGAANIMLLIGEQVNGGVYGELFQDDEVEKYTDPTLFTPDITPRTEFDHLFAAACDHISPNSGEVVFPRTSGGYLGVAPQLESLGLFTNLFRVT